MRKTTTFVCTLACVLAGALSSSGQWQQTSASFGSKVNCMATNGTTIFAGTDANGIFRSTDNGDNWTAVNTGLFNTIVYSIAISGSNIFAGTWGGGVFVSANNGATWALRDTAISIITGQNTGVTGYYISGLTVSGIYIFAATGDAGLFRSGDGGDHWIGLDTGLTTTYLISMDKQGTNLYTGSNYGGLFLSRDNGAHWVDRGMTSYNIYTLASQGANTFAASRIGGVFLSGDTGNTWVPVNNGLTNTKIFSLAASGTSVLAGSDGGGVFVSKDTGSSWSSFNIGGLSTAGVYSLAINGSTIFAGIKDGRVWKRALSDINACDPVIVASDYAICQGSSATITALNGSRYVWSTGDTTQSISVTTAGIYSCIITTPCGALTSNTVTLTVKPLPDATIWASGPTTLCKSNRVTLSITGGLAYLWSNGRTIDTLKNIATTQNLSVSVLGANGCRAVSPTVHIVAIPAPFITSQPKNDTTYAGCIPAFFAIRDTNVNLLYQWQVNVGSGFNNISNGGIYSGVNTDSLVISSAFSLMNGYSYRCFLSNSGCADSTSSALLVVKPAITASRVDTLCSGDSLTIGNHTYKTSGTYIDTLSSVQGCDSVLSSRVVFASLLKRTQTITLCQGQSVTVGIATHDVTGTFIDTLTSVAGCDSVVTTKLTISPALKDSVSVTLCAGDSLIVGSHTYTASGIYKDTLTTLSGCDSVLTTNLAFSSELLYSQSVTLCAGQAFTVGINTYDTSGIYVDSLIATAGCDSIVTTHLTITPAVTSSQTDTLCTGDSFTVGINTYTTSGNYIDTLQTINGCDSIVTSNLVFGSTVKSSQTITLCAGLSLTVGANIHSTSGTYVDTLMSVIGGCDSLVTSNLVITPAVTSSQTLTLCKGAILTVGIHTHSTSGTYIDTVTTGSGCDSIVTSRLFYVSDTTFTTSGKLSAKTSPALYQWFNCADRDVILAITQSYTPIVDGSYAVIVTSVNGCSDTSACLTVSNVGIKAMSLNYSILVYPNPATTQLTVRGSSSLTNKAVTISVLNVIGEMMQQEKIGRWNSDAVINISKLSSGMYFLQMKTEDGNAIMRFIKE